MIKIVSVSVIVMWSGERDANGVRIKDKHGENIFIYEPKPVNAVKRMIEITEYFPINT